MSFIMQMHALIRSSVESRDTLFANSIQVAMGKGVKTTGAGVKVASGPAHGTKPKVMVRRPDAVVMRLQGVLVSDSWDRQMDKFAVEKVRDYLWDKRTERINELLIQRLREDAALDRDCGDAGQVPQIPESGTPEQVIGAVVEYMQWCVNREPDQHPFSPVTLLKDSVCKEGMAAGQLLTPVFQDAERMMRGWRFGQHFIKNYTLAVPDADDQQRLLTYTTVGDLKPIIANFIRLGQIQKALLPRTYRTIVAMIRSEAQDILFLTNSQAEANAAHASGLTVLLVRRPDQTIPAYDKDCPNTHSFPVVHSYDEISFISDPNRPAPCC